MDNDADLLSVSEYARMYDVGEGTVRQWIRRGKIRTAIKNGNQWLIPLLSFPPSRGYESAQYHWKDVLLDIPEEYAFFNDYDWAFFSQDRKDKSLFHVLLSNTEQGSKGNPMKKEITLSAQEREKLELYMIANSAVHYGNRF